MTRSQTDAVLAYLRTHPEGLTPLDALALGMGYRLAARISDAKQRLEPGESIVTLTEKHDGGTHARYVLRRVRSTLWDGEECAA